MPLESVPEHILVGEQQRIQQLADKSRAPARELASKAMDAEYLRTHIGGAATALRWPTSCR